MFPSSFVLRILFQAVAVFLGPDSHAVTCAASRLPFLTASPAVWAVSSHVRVSNVRKDCEGKRDVRKFTDERLAVARLSFSLLPPHHQRTVNQRASFHFNVNAT